MYNDMLTGTLFAKDSCECAVLLDPSVAPQRLLTETNASCSKTCLFSPTLGACGSSAPDAMAPKIKNKHDTSENASCLVCHPRKIVLLQLTLIKMMLAKVQSRGVEVGTKQKYLDIIGSLLKEANIDSKLIQLLCTSDKLLSHMASKTLVSLVHFQLTEEGSLNSIWLSFCSETLSQFPQSGQTAECLWTLTNITGEILKGENLCKGDELKKLFTPLDNVLEGFYNGIMSHPGVLHGTSASAKPTNGLISFLDLLELLVASRSQTQLSFACQRMLFQNAACVLGLTTSPVHSLIKKKSILLLKRCILHKAGEDLIKGREPPSSLLDPHFDQDRLTLASAVLQFVNSGWLNRLPVREEASHFAGSQLRPEVAMQSGPDQVTLRAVSLILLKALEVKIQDSATKAEAQVHLESVMHSLLIFLKKYLRPPPGVGLLEHPCTWLSVLFIEQDDDMLEAAKALLTVHLKLERFWREVSFASCSSDEGIWDTLTHRNGCNPHCVFLFLLRSIAFDVTVLLDFLISSETCFLEYFVRYLKLLLEDWPHFVKISKCFKPEPLRVLNFSLESLSKQGEKTLPSGPTLQSASYDRLSCPTALLTFPQNCSLLRRYDSQAVKPGSSDHLRVSDKTSSIEPLQRLVDYESSEDSEGEWIGVECLTDRKQTSSAHQACTERTVSLARGDQAETSGQNVLPPDQNSSNTSSLSHCSVSPSDPGSGEAVLEKSVECFRALHGSISRLQRRNLFPYNPGALLKLLTRVDAISREHRSTPEPVDGQDLPLHSFHPAL
ncbi:protein Lines homolog 1 isoform X2 [Hemicordylus capensis]|nr:protein Lines homolog 1 isoform X2 [Hemicordylus capensis]XP_053128546.1 protein Lines homolog 1 isoform X2 [Hemicordylus capensis]XP_053128547.1 protein Lines homolog 1 isoform X2 [Hemicordylus capensis]XP_053128548.1 protein Lines homolog 1 isoform X2 [Hemicordylus capensis]